jgi:hypothetical protein
MNITFPTEEEFKNFKGVSYSRLSRLAQDPQAYKAYLAEDGKKSSAMGLGTVVDILLTQPDKLHEEVYIMTAVKPNSEPMQIFCEVYAETDDKSAAHAACGFKINLERTMKKFEEEGKAYYNALIAGKGKIIVDAELMFTANKLVNDLKTNEYTKKYFIPEEGVDLHFQVPILWSFPFYPLPYEGSPKPAIVHAKSLLDILRIDHREKVIQPVDLKTGAESFYKGYFRYKRYLQGSMYHDATVQMFIEDEAVMQEYSIENTRFIHADTNLVYPPTIFRMSDVDTNIGRTGRSHMSSLDVSQYGIHTLNLVPPAMGQRVKGYVDLAAELDWHIRNDKWDYSYNTYQNNGEVDIDALNVKL